MNIFVAGGTGVIGRRAVRQLVDAGHAVSVLSRSDAKAREIRTMGATPVSGSLFEPEALVAAVAGHEVVINLATHIPPLSQGTRSSAWVENDRIRIEGAHNLVDAALAAGAGRYVQESIAFVYADHGEAWIDEGEPQIETPYSAGVASAEREAARFAAQGGVGVVLRFGQFYAAESVHSISMLKGARRGWALMPGALDAYTTPIHADDAAAAVVAALGAPSGVFNIVDDDPVTRAGWAEVLAGAVGRSKLRPLPKVVQNAAGKKSPNLVSSQRVSNAAFKAATRWKPQYPSFRDGAATLVHPSGDPSTVR